MKIEDLKTKILNELGGWPLLMTDWNNATFNWTQFIYNINSLDYSTSFFMWFGIDIDSRNSSRRMLSVSF